MNRPSDRSHVFQLKLMTWAFLLLLKTTNSMNDPKFSSQLFSDSFFIDSRLVDSILKLATLSLSLSLSLTSFLTRTLSLFLIHFERKLLTEWPWCGLPCSRSVGLVVNLKPRVPLFALAGWLSGIRNSNKRQVLSVNNFDKWIAKFFYDVTNNLLKNINSLLFSQKKRKVKI